MKVVTFVPKTSVGAFLANNFRRHGVNILFTQAPQDCSSAHETKRKASKTAATSRESTLDTSLPAFASVAQTKTRRQGGIRITTDQEKSVAGTDEEHKHSHNCSDAGVFISRTTAGVSVSCTTPSLLPLLVVLVANVLQICQEAATTARATIATIIEAKSSCDNSSSSSRSNRRPRWRKSCWSLSLLNLLACVVLLQHGGAKLRVEAVFAPADLIALKVGWSSCKSENGGTGDCPTFANLEDGSGGKNGLIHSWNVSRVTSMDSCEWFNCLLVSCFFFFILSLF
jgi:hypothetical protein